MKRIVIGAFAALVALPILGGAVFVRAISERVEFNNALLEFLRDH